MRSAFSLVELSIVLVILGLLTGGILAGQSLISAAELRAVSVEHDEIVTAVNQFKEKYNALPGDFRDATRFWLRQGNLGGYAASCTTNSSAALNATSQQGACDGDGDGTIQLYVPLSTSEDAQFWQHLKMSGLFNVKVRESAGDAGIGINFGATRSLHNSRYPNGLWGAFYYPPVAAVTTNVGAARVGNNVHILMFGASNGNFQPPHTRLLKPEEAWNLDVKSDDGKSTLGKLRVTYTGTVWDNCRSGNDYALSDTQRQCSMAWVSPF